MTESGFVAYLQEPDVHDGVVLRIRNEGERVRVLVRAYDGRLHAIEFYGTHSVTSRQAEGMLLYSISEMAAPLGRRFVFTDWEEGGDRFLEVTAEGFGSEEIAGEDAF